MLEEPELSKRQHPGKRYLMLLHKRQHPGRREPQEAEGDFSDLDKRQHPGKRLCEDWTETGCDPARVLLELLEEKRQHPGKRLELEDDLTERE